MSEKRQRRNEQAREFRENLVLRVGKCEICNHRWQQNPPQTRRLCVHEIANGPHRHKAIDQAYAVLVVCWACNSELCDKSHMARASATCYADE